MSALDRPQSQPRKGPSGATIFLRSVIGRAYPRVIGMQREKSWLFFDILLPFMSTMSYVLVYKAIGAPESFKGLVTSTFRTGSRRKFSKSSCPKFAATKGGRNSAASQTKLLTCLCTTAQR